MDNYRKYLEQIYAKNLAKAESKEYYNGFYEKDIKFYEYNKKCHSFDHRWNRFIW